MKKNYPTWIFKAFAMMALVNLAIVSCSKDDDEPQEPGKLGVSENVLEYSAEGGSQSLEVSCTSDWTISGDPTWVTVTPQSGFGTKKVNIKVAENTTGADRECELYVGLDSGAAEETVVIRQAKAAGNITVGSNDLNFSCGDEKNFQSDTKTLQIRTNSSWTISGQPDWVSLSSTSGNGDQTISVSTKSFNNSPEARTATLTITTADDSSTATVKLIQEAGLVPDCKATPANIVSLYNGIAFNYEFGKNTTKYFRGYLKKSLVGSMSEAEIITILENNDDRYTVNPDVFTDFSGLEENTAYYIYTLGYNNEGKRGELVREEVTTKKLLSNWELNEPMAWIDYVSLSGDYWIWSITKGTRCRTYLEGETESETLAFASDVAQAWMLNYWWRTNQIYEYENPEPLRVKKSGNLLAVFTWGKDNNGVWAGLIDWDCAIDNDASGVKAKAKVANKKGTNHRLPSKGELRVRMKSY